MRYPIAIESGDAEHAYGAVVPDLPGCFSAGDSLEEVIDAAREAVALWVDEALDAGMEIPPPSSLRDVSSAYGPGWALALVEIEPAIFDDRPERVNISLPRRVLARLDRLAKHAGTTRSGWIAAQTLRRGSQP
ncbi:MAG: type II toxin-antitoxin system HicB family antitoxin [Deltaproteobacteria bacterium]|nr:type II toxin-antitoxin system HicB family antitoxin [Deltaproteobacteria bacterium]